MTKFKLIGSLVDTIKEQGLGRYSGFYLGGEPEELPIGYNLEDDEVLTTTDIEDFESISSEEIDDIKKLETFPAKGKCPSWSHLSKNGVKNGELSSSDLQSLKYHPNHKLSAKAAKHFDKLEEEFKKEKGRYIDSSLFTDSYRPYSVQWSIFDYDHCIKTGEFKKINYHKFGVSKPGTSNHGWGEAVDIFDEEWQKFAKEHGKKYGWCWGENKSEPHHFTYDKKYCD